MSIQCRQAASFIEMLVTDTGRGIAPEDVVRVFNEFHQIDSSNAQHGRGLGLGLSIVKRLSNLLDITITLDSRLGEGSQFTLQIPAGQLSENCGERRKNAVILPEALTVLIVDDDRSIRFGMEVLLESYGCKTLCAEDADSAIQLLKASTEVPEIIVMDYHISTDQTGIQALAALRTFLDAKVPAILVTGDTSQDSERDAAIYKLPVLHKPVDSDALLAAINNEVCLAHR